MPTGREIILYVTERRNTSTKYGEQYLIWKGDVLNDNDLSKVLRESTTGDLSSVSVKSTTGTAVLDLMSSTTTKDMLGLRTLILNVKADGTIQEVIIQIQAMLGGPDPLDYLLSHRLKLLSEEKTVADCQINSNELLVCTEYLKPVSFC